jgi:uncharacterized membrane protein
MEPLLRFGVIGDAWRLYQRRWWTWSLATLIALIGYSIVGSTLFAVFGTRWHGGTGGFRLPVRPGAGALHYVSTIVVVGFFLGGMIRMANRQVLGQVPRIEDMFSVVDVGLQLLAGAVFYGAATFLGWMLCVIPGLIVSGLLMFMMPLIVIARKPPTDAFGESWRVLRSQWLSAAVFHLVLSMTSLMGVILCGVGVLFTGPLYSLSIAILFHEFFEPVPSAYGKKSPVDPDGGSWPVDTA